MKKVLFLLSFCILLNIKGQAQAHIIAGQTSGDYIYYTDFEPDSSVQLFNGGEGFLVDVDHNGQNDLAFNVFAEYDPNHFALFWSSVKTINNHVKILSDLGYYNLALNLEAGDTISANQSWSSEYDSTYDLSVHYYNYYPPPGNDTIFGLLGSGYMGFKIEYPNDTFYGWINLSASSTSIVVKECAVYGLSVGIEKSLKAKDPFHVFPNPCADELNLNLPTKNFEKMSFEIINMLGKIVKHDDIMSSYTKISTSGLEAGFYLLRIRERDGETKSIKFIKRYQ